MTNALKSLPDPRRFDTGHDNALAALARRAPNEASATQQENFLSVCAAIADALADGRETAVREAGRLTGSAAATALYWRAVEQALSPPPENALQIRVFAIPILIVAGGRADAVVSGVIPNPAALSELLARAGAFGPMRNFGLSNALATAESLESVALTELYRIARAADPDFSPGLDLPPEDIRTATAEEAVYLRFFAGAAVTAHAAPSFVETAASVGAWGMPFTRALSTQLQTPGLSVLPVPRPPQDPLQALRNGRFAQRELGFQLFLSNALRKARMRSGDPDVTLAAHADESIRVRLTSPFDESLDEQYRWPLDPVDDLAAVTDSICSLLAECRLDRIDILDTVQDVEKKN
ncbi:MAG TPA: hypothetical protein VMP00_15585 [Burkholderiales bacterium]|nr:hypothetical protein [Burkholderiales bacterium]